MIDKVFLVSTLELSSEQEEAVQKFVLTKFPSAQFVKNKHFVSSVEFIGSFLEMLHLGPVLSGVKI